MSKTDIEQKRAKESQEWNTRGITGRVTAVNTQTNQVTVEIRGLGAATSTVLTPKSGASFKRYAPNSIKFDEAKTSSLAEIAPGDMIRALGDRSADGTSFSAEQVISGAFQTVAGTIKSIDVSKNEVVVADLQTKKDITISFASASIMKLFPAEMAERLASAQGGGPRPPGQGNPNAGSGQPRPQGAPGAPGEGRPGGGGMGRPGGGMGRGSIDDMLERFPNIAVADLKVGDMIAVSSTRTSDMSRINAIKLLAGVGPFLRNAQAQPGNGGRGRGGVDSGFSIPGLDGVGFP